MCTPCRRDIIGPPETQVTGARYQRRARAAEHADPAHQAQVGGNRAHSRAADRPDEAYSPQVAPAPPRPSLPLSSHTLLSLLHSASRAVCAESVEA